MKFNLKEFTEFMMKQITEVLPEEYHETYHESLVGLHRYQSPTQWLKENG